MPKAKPGKKLKELLYRTSMDAALGAGLRRPVKTSKIALSPFVDKDPEVRRAAREVLKKDPRAREALRMALTGPAVYTAGAATAGAVAASKYKQAHDARSPQMDNHTQDMAGRIMAHAFNDELEKLSMEKEAKMSNKVKMMLAGAGGLAVGGAGGAAAGYKMEQGRLSPQERKIVNNAMQHAYKQGNMAMYNRLKSMAAQRGAGKGQ